MTPWTVAHQAPLSLGFSRQEHWSCHFLLQSIFSTRGSNLGLLHQQAESLLPEPLGSPTRQGYNRRGSNPLSRFSSLYLPVPCPTGLSALTVTLTFLNGGLGWRPRRGCSVPREAGKDLSFPNLSRPSPRSTTSKDGQNCIRPFFSGGISCF